MKQITIIVQTVTLGLMYNPKQDCFIHIFEALKQDPLFQNMLKNVRSDIVYFYPVGKNKLKYRNQKIKDVVQESLKLQHYVMIFSSKQINLSIQVQDLKPVTTIFGSDVTLQFLKKVAIMDQDCNFDEDNLKITQIFINDQKIENDMMILSDVQKQFGNNQRIHIKLYQNQLSNSCSSSDTFNSIDINQIAKKFSKDSNPQLSERRFTQMTYKQIQIKKIEDQGDNMINYAPINKSQQRKQTQKQFKKKKKQVSGYATQSLMKKKQKNVLSVVKPAPNVNDRNNSCNSPIRRLSINNQRNSKPNKQQKAQQYNQGCCSVKPQCIIF